MAKANHSTPSQIVYMKRRLAQVAEERATAPTPAALAQLLLDLEAPSPAVRAAALEQICPAHLAWAAFAPVRQAAKRLQTDPHPTVRTLARALEEAAAEIADLEAMRDLLAEEVEEQDEWKQQERKRNKKQRYRQKEL
jgi:Skp family chaperone for outer membrane proteins